MLYKLNNHVTEPIIQAENPLEALIFYLNGNGLLYKLRNCNFETDQAIYEYYTQYLHWTITPYTES